MKLILVRHAKAQDRSLGILDLERPLLEIGIERLQQVVPELRKLTAEDRDIALWASPAARSQETAILIGQGLGLDHISTFAFIYHGERSKLIEALRTHKQLKTLILVGHEPDLSEWIGHLTGEYHELRTAGFAVLEVTNLDPPEAHITATMQPDTRDEDASSNKDPVIHLKKVLLDGLASMQETLEAFEATPQDPKTTHAFRVSTRRLRTYWSFLRPILDKDVYQSVRGRLKRLMGHYGVAREYDVLAEQIRDYREINNVQGSEDLPAYIDELRYAELECIQSKIDNGTLAGDLLIVERALQNLHITDVSKKTSKKLKKRYQRWSEKANDALSDLNYEELSSIHSLRIRFKKLRYVKDALPEFAESGASLDAYEAMQDDLGFICDTFVNEELLKRLVTDEASLVLRQQSKLFDDYQSRERHSLIRTLKSNMD